MSYTVRKSSMKIQTSSGEKIIPGILTESREASLTAITNARTSAVSAIGTAKTEATDAIAAKGAEVLASIPEDYTDLIEDVEANTSGYASLLTDLNATKKALKIEQRNVENLKALLKDTDYKDVVDDNVAHSKVLGDAEVCGDDVQVLPNGLLNSIGGRTVVWNQLSRNDAKVNTITKNGITVTQEGNVIVVNGTSTASIYDFIYATDVARHINLTAGHRYYLKGKYTALWASGDDLTAGSSDSAIVTPKKTTTYVHQWIIYNSGVEFSNYKFIPVIIDLTQMFGADVAATMTVDAFEALFDTSVYHPYNAGTLMSLPCKQVVTQGQNMLDLKKIKPFNSKCTVTVEGSKITYKNDNSYAVNLFETPTSWFLISLKRGVTYYFSCNNTLLYSLDGYREDTKKWYATFIVGGRSNGSYTAIEDITLRLSNQCKESSTTVCDSLMISEGLPIVSYKEFCRTSLVIPQSVRNRPGYGWSAGTAKNSIYWNDEGRLIERLEVDRIDFVTVTWGLTTSYAINRFSCGISKMKITGGDVSDMSDGIACSKYITSEKPISSVDVDKTIGRYNGRIYILDSSYSDVESFKSAMSGNYIYYELAEPVETDITDLLPPNFDNLLTSLETGGTVTFVADGVAPDGTTVLTSDEQSLPVPNTIAYQTKIAS